MMTNTKQEMKISSDYNEVINNINYCYGVSIDNKSGATGYNLRFYIYPDAVGSEPKRLTAKSGGYKMIDVYEDSEVGSVEFRLGSNYYRIDFGHDGNEPLTAYLTKIAKPAEWTYEKTIQQAYKNESKETVAAFVSNRKSYFQSICDTAEDAAQSLASYMSSCLGTETNLKALWEV